MLQTYKKVFNFLIFFALDVGIGVKIKTNVLQLGEESGFEALTFNLALMLF